MRDINDVVAKIYRLARYKPGRQKHNELDRYLYEKIYAEVYGLLVDQLLSVANALAPEGEDEVQITNWLQTKLASIAEQLPKPTEHKLRPKERSE
jgi:hypothetical protein